MPSRVLKNIPSRKRRQPPPASAAVTSNNSIVLLKNGSDFFPSLLTAIDSATHDIRIETFIFRDDAIGQHIATALKNAAGRGVSVRLVIDGMGLWGTHESFLNSFKQAGIELAIFRPERRFFSFKKGRLRRVHRKIALIDGRIGFIGGINLIGDLTEAMSDTEPRYDYAVRIEGPLLEDVYVAVNRLWRVLQWSSLRHQLEPLYSPVNIAPAGEMDARFVVRDNLRYRRSIEDEYMSAITSAKKTILIVSPYFLPGRILRTELREAAKRGVAVTLLLQGRADHPLLQLATRALYESLLDAGVIIYEYEIAMLHGKVAVIDDGWATVGSSNLDPCSLFLNREANIVVLSSGFANELRESVNAEITRGGRRLQIHDWQRRGRWARIKSWSAYGLAQLIAGWVGFQNEWGG